ncbi:peptidase S9 prolyl oligopeptidase [Actinoplanes sp. SE50]|uniref:alpha/beta hydrolase family protein n=1 Tax=unclassified Actinoplanes TaxID=2626549 RepID=UPI00023ECB57|nr:MULTISPECIES: alpha/beta fold hydrolase [unclassified Actinoplanes]AEV85425.1 peptidase S9 prolyl oligopeptidase [Actinoplanes sp. SE50/110]ATO83820.1 peptidase S9 prolyl oligopeptidase [Actinoplanes sp. SE50]SLM01228.1 hypothetical protein ACSP50_4464 [Actinoplanes sp. SE50/110]
MSSPATAQVTARISFRFSADGSRAVCMAADERGRHRVESWQLGTVGPRLSFTAPVTGDPRWMMPLPVDADRALLTWFGAGGALTAELLDRDGGRTTLGTFPAPLRVIGAPAATGFPALGWADAPESAGTTLHRLGVGTPWLRPVAEVPGRLRDAVACGDRVLVTTGHGGRSTRMIVDPRDGTCVPAPWLDGLSRVLACAGRRVLATVRRPEGPTVVLADLDTGEPRWSAPGDWCRPEVYPVALDPTGTSIAVVQTRGARSRLLRWDTMSRAAHPVTMPDSDLVPLAAWTPNGLWLPRSGPDRPCGLAWLPPGADRLRVPAPPSPPWSPGRLETFPGAGGPVEAVVHGPDWRSAAHVVVALHGGPASRWSLTFEPLFQALATAGVAVVAPNQRGSTGYGTAHARAIVGAWGVPDLADVAAIGAFLGSRRGPGRPRPALYGVSYGAYLALLAAATQPDAWSACAALAPFLSGPRLHADGHPAVRGMVERLDGLTEADDEIGPRDVARLASGLRAPLLLVHGAQDESTPVAHSRLLAERLTALGRSRGVDLHYLEPPDRGHAVLGTAVQDPVTAVVTRFLAESRPTVAPAPTS